MFHMPNLILLAMLTSAALCVSLNEIRDTVYAVNQQGLSFTPFKIVQDSGENPATLYSLTYSCDQVRGILINIGSPNFDFCDASPLKGTAAELNAKLQALPLVANSTSNTSAPITFVLSDDKTAKLASATINFTPLATIPILNRVSLLEVTTAAFESADDAPTFTIASIEPAYCDNFGSSGLKIQASGKPSTFHFKFNQCKVTVRIDITNRLNPTNITLTVADSLTGLSSNTWSLLVTAQSSSSSAFSSADFWIFVVISLSIICCFLVMLCYANSKANEYDRAREETNGVRMSHQIDLKNQTIEMKPNVLSDSILTWNQQLMAKHQRKNFKASSDFEKNMKNILRGPTSKDEVAAIPTVTTNQEPARPFEDISEIGTVDLHRSMRVETHQKDDSYFDEYHI